MNISNFITEVNNIINSSYPTLIGVVLGLLGLIYSFDATTEKQKNKKQKNLENMYIVIFLLICFEIISIVYHVVKIVIPKITTWASITIIINIVILIINIIMYINIIKSLCYVGRKLLNVNRTFRK